MYNNSSSKMNSFWFYKKNIQNSIFTSCLMMMLTASFVTYVLATCQMHNGALHCCSKCFNRHYVGSTKSSDTQEKNVYVRHSNSTMFIANCNIPLTSSNVNTASSISCLAKATAYYPNGRCELHPGKRLELTSLDHGQSRSTTGRLSSMHSPA